jgi:SNF2 family DNA or RNA helicase
LHSICEECAEAMRQQCVGQTSLSCPHCRMSAERASIAIIAPRKPTASHAGDGGAQGQPLGDEAAEVAEGGESVAAGRQPSEVRAESESREDTKPAVAVRLAASLLGEADDERVVILGQWRGVLDGIGKELERCSIPYLSLCYTNLEGRLDALRRFGKPGEPRVLLLSSDAHASGINLQCARHVLLLHPHCPENLFGTADNPGAALYHRSVNEARAYEAQAVGRVRRFPQTREVHVHRLYVRGTVEETLLAEQGLL